MPPPSTILPQASVQRVGLLRVGSHGPAVRALQQRLTRLGYWLGRVDGSFGDLTRQAVLALQKTAGLARDGVVGPHTRAALRRAVRPRPRSTAGRVIEIDKKRQVLLVVHDGVLRWTFNTSTGSGAVYVSQGATHLAVTPSGRFRIYRQVNGRDVSPLGVLWRPKYFNGGIAIHGYGDVPPYPASHGCVRVSNAAIDYFWAHRVAPLGTTVWVY